MPYYGYGAQYINRQPSFPVGGSVHPIDDMFANDVASSQFGDSNKRGVADYARTSDADLFGLSQWYKTADTLLQEPEVEGRSFWKSLASGAKNVFETLAIPQQIIFKAITNDDWREAIPSWIAPDSWEESGIEHEFMTFSDVVNVWSHGELDEWYQKEGIWNQAGEVGLKSLFFLGDVFTDPLTYVPVANTVKLARKALPVEMQARLSAKAALKSGVLGDAQHAVDRAGAALLKYERLAESNPTAEIIGRRDMARKHLAEMEAHLQEISWVHKEAGEEAIVKNVAPIADTQGGPVQLELFDSTPFVGSSAKRADPLEVTIEELKNIGPMERVPYYTKLLGMAQRNGRPEDLMNAIQYKAGGGVINPMVEHIGDLTHRLADPNTLGHSGGFQFVKEKVDRGIHYLTSEYGFNREFMENLTANAKHRGVKPKDLKKEVFALMDDYADAHRALPVFNEVQELARDAAVKIGERDFDGALKRLNRLKVYLDEGKDAWNRRTLEFDANIAKKNIKETADISSTLSAGSAEAIVEKELRQAAAAKGRQGKLWKRTTQKDVDAAEAAHAANPTEETAAKLAEVKENFAEWKKLREAHNAERARLRTINRATQTDDVAHNATIIEDKAAQVSNSLGDAVLGTHPKDVFLRDPARVEHYYNGMDVIAPGINARGAINAVADDIPKARAVAGSRLAAARAELRSALANGANKETLKPLEKNVRKLEAHVKRLDDPEYVKKLLDGEIQMPGEFMPKAARRSPLLDDEYFVSQYGKAAETVAGVMLYPRAVLPAPPGWFNHLFREPSRAYGNTAPEIRDRMMGGMRQYQAFMNYTRQSVKDILKDAGVYDVGIHKQAAAKALRGSKALVVNKERSKMMYNILDREGYIAKHGEAAYAALVEGADQKLLDGAGAMRDFMDAMAKRLGIDPEDYIEGYMPHIMKRWDDAFINKGWFNGGKLPPEFEGMGLSKIHFGALLERNGSGEGYIDDIAKAIDWYTRGAGRKLYVEPLITDMKHMVKKRIQDDPKNQWMFGYTKHLIANLKGKPSSLHEIMASVITPEKRHLLQRSGSMFASLTYAAALTGNMRYPVMSMVQALNTTTAKYGPLASLEGLARMMTPRGRAVAHAAGVDTEVMAIYEGVGDWATKLKTPWAPRIQDTEFAIRGLTFTAEANQLARQAGYASLDAVEKEAPELFKDIVATAVRSTEEINHVFGVIGKPVLFGRASKTGSQLATQFFSFPFKQTETLLDIGMSNPGRFVDYLYSAGKIQQLIAKEMNVDVSEYVGVTYTDDIRKMIAGERVALPLQTLGKLVTVPYKMAAMLDGVDPGDGEALMKEISDGVENLIPAIRGMEQVSEGGATLAAISRGEERDVRKRRRGTLESLARAAAGQGSYGELKYGELRYKKDQESLVTVLTGLQTVQGKIEQEIGQRMYERQRKVSAIQESLTTEIWDGVRTGTMDNAALREKILRLNQLGFKYKDISQIKDRTTRAVYAANMVTKLREQYVDKGSIAAYSQALRKKVEDKYK